MKGTRIKGTVLAIATMFAVSLYILAEGEKSVGGYVEDPVVSVPANAYVTFSTTYNGHRYYLGVDTVQAKAGKDTVTWYESANYATIWIAGPLWSPTGAILSNKDYTRTVKSVWLSEKVSRERYLAKGANMVGYSPLRLLDEANATMWHTEKDAREQNKYINGFMYEKSEEDGLEKYRYLSYDPVYGFSRLFETKPSASQQISVWDRKQGADLISDMRMATNTFGWETNGRDTTKYQITTQVIYFDSIDRFRSRFDQMDVFAYQSDSVKDQATLADPDGEYKLFGYYEWKSNQTVDPANVLAYNGKSCMPYYQAVINYNGSEDPADWTYDMTWVDSTLLYVREDGFRLDTERNIWIDSIYAIGSAPMNMYKRPSGGGAPTGEYANHNDWLYMKFACKGKNYVDSIQITRHTFHRVPFIDLSLASSPGSKEFPYSYNNKLADETTNISVADTAITFTITGRYSRGYTVYNTINAAVTPPIEGEGFPIDWTLPCHRDTLWIYDADTIVLDGSGNPTYSDIVLYDTLLVEAYEEDGVTPCTWVDKVYLAADNQIRLKVQQYDPDTTANRVGLLQYTYRYWHSSAVGDQQTATSAIWFTQKWKGADDSKLYTFTHKAPLIGGIQAAHEVIDTLYAIPEEALSLPIHRDHWGYYRWFIYDDPTHPEYKDRDPEHASTWAFGLNEPTNHKATDNKFMPINIENSTASRGRWDIRHDTQANSAFVPEHFVTTRRTPVPAIDYPASNSQSGKIACDVSAYYDINTHGQKIGKLKELTEPTLSYRQVFHIKPAKLMADMMADCRVNGGSGHNKWMEERTIIAPAGRTIDLQPMSPISIEGIAGNEAALNEDELQYIYYFNPDATGTVDNNMGVKKSTVADTKSECYARIGKKYVSGKTIRRAKLLTAAEVLEDIPESGKNVVIINALNGGNGFVLGKKDNDEFATWGGMSSITDTAKIREWIETNVLNPDEQSIYILHVKKKSDDVFSVTHVASGMQITLSGTIFGINGLGWNDNYILGDQTTDIKIAAYPGAASTAINSKFSANLISMHMYLRYKIWSWHTRQGYLTGSSYSWGRFSNSVHYNEETVGSAANQAWLVYEIVEPEDEEHFETPVWEIYNGSTWVPVAHWDYSTNSSVSDQGGYTMSAYGSLQIANTVHTVAGQVYQYRLRTEHFQLAKVTLVTRDINTEGPKQGAGSIISEDDIQANYTVLFDLGKDDWAKPGTTDVKAYDHALPWSFTELSYHRPLSAIPAAQRDSTTEMPLKGEYAFINKFVVPSGGANTQNSGTGVECLDGAANGYMLCVNADDKRTTIMKFPYPSVSCSNQQIYLVADFCNPVKNPFDPQITADLEGTKDGGATWELIYRFKTGRIPYVDNPARESDRWFQMALPIDRDRIKDYDMFRCSAMLNGATNLNAQLLIDRLRFIEKSRSFSVFQNKATCIHEDSITALIRLNYKADQDLYKPGKLVAYQFQKWDASANGGEGAYVPMLASTDNGDGTYTALTHATGLEVFPGYMKDAFTTTESVTKTFLKTTAGNDYGYVMIPEANYDPSTSNVSPSAKRVALIEQAITKLDLTGDAATARRNFKDERNNIRTLDQVVTSDYVDFGGTSTPHVKSFVKEGDNWVIYIVTRLPISATDNKTFRIGMTVMDDLDDTPTFTEEACATFHIFDIKQTTSLRVDGVAWTNYTLAQVTADPSLRLAANETYRASVALTVDATIQGHNTSNPLCKFDLLHMTNEMHADTSRFRTQYGFSLAQFIDDMEAFRIDDDRNEVRNITSWSDVTPAKMTGTGRTLPVATAIYNRLNTLVTAGVLELGLDYRDIYMGDRADSYFYLIPVPASGSFVLENGSSTSTDTTVHTSVCNDTLWLELHSQEPTAKLRYGFDSRVGDTYIVPTVRASLTDATTGLKVRVAEMTAAEGRSVVIGYDSTYLIESNDPSWTGAQVFKYRQDKDMRSHKPSETTYYNKGDIITFTPKPDGNTISLKAGYWYRFKSAFYAPLSSETYPAADPTTPIGHSQFILAIAPDTVRWTPEHTGKANYWNDDHNWTPVMANTPADGFKATVPMGDTKVIIPAVAEGELPIASDVVENQVDTLHYGYKKNTCKKILFKPRSQILGQEKLTYETAFIDVLLKTGNWQTYSAALDDVYSGDMYIPYSTSYSSATPGSGASTDNEDFNPKSFPYGTGYSGTYNPRVYPFAFYQGFYNASVPVPFYNTDLDGTPINNNTKQKSKNSVDWVKTPSLEMHYAPGSACVLLGYDETDADGNEIVVRLPKPDDSYNGFGQYGGSYIAGPAITISRPNKMNHNLAYDQYAAEFDANDGKTYTLHNETASDIFFFGNPTMSLVDVYKLCVDNAGVLKHEGGTYQFTAYKLIDSETSTYTVKTIDGPGQFFIAPERAVGLIAASEATSLTIQLKPSALVAITGDGMIVSHEEIVAPAPKRLKAEETTINKKRLFIAASNETDWGRKKAYVTLGEQEGASTGYVYGEDALNISSGLNYYSDESFATPLNMYTISDNMALMQDIRDTLGTVPLVFTTLPDYTYDDYTRLSFYTDGEWDAPLYLYDAVTGDSLLIRNGLEVAVRTPQSDQLRYFINGRAPKATEDTNVATGIDNTGVTTEDNASLKDGRTFIYDILGRRVCVLGENELMSNIQLPTGVYILQRSNKTERIIVK